MTIISSFRKSSRRWAAKAADRGHRRRLWRLGVLGLAVFLSAGFAGGYVRIILNGKKLKWPDNELTWQWNSSGSDDISDASEEAAVVQAFRSWESVSASRIRFQRKSNTTSKNVGASSHLVLFDENNHTGYFPIGTGIVAITPIAYNPSNGTILDADIIFNGRDWTWSTTGHAGSFDVQDVATHEIGHFMGLDHSPAVCASMWPYVSPGQWLHRSLSPDDRSGAVALASNGNEAILRGSLRRPDGSDLKGGVIGVVEVNSGILVATALSDRDGDWRVRGLSAGDYYVYATPLEGAMSNANLTSNEPVHTAFGADFYGGFPGPTPYSLSAGQDRNLGAKQMPADHDMEDGTGSPFLLNPGDLTTLTLWGSEYEGMDVQTLSPYLTVQNVSNGRSWVQLNLSVAVGCPTGSYDLLLTRNDGAFDVAVGLVEIVAEAPTLSTLTPAVGTLLGGNTVTLSGSGFQDGAFVLFDGVEADNVQFQDSSTLSVEPPAHDPGAVSVTVHNPDGQTVHQNSVYTYAGVPTFNALFPGAGQVQGGTLILINGADFAEDMEVLLGGVSLPVTWQSSKVVRVTTTAHASGSVDLTLRNPGTPDVVVSDAFEFVNNADPTVTGFTPGSGSESGGLKVQLFGQNLGDTFQVSFGVDPATGQGGKEASSLQVLTSSQIEAITPSHAPGNFGVLLTTASGQGVLAGGTFRYMPAKAEAQSGGGGGGCGGVLGAPSQGFGDFPALAALFCFFTFLRRRRSPAV
ncbi:MAG: hypothetical protein DWQ01_19795 [Planctomycetota bacterium]|nr:MAG: hypothetical protein DWQ01_19795 [Planctomycetota bacterium]